MSEPSSEIPQPFKRNPIKFASEQLLKVPVWLRIGLFGLGMGVVLFLPGIAGIWAVRHLLGLAELPDCRATAEASDSFSARLYCADEIARKQTVGDLRDAIKLASSIPEDDPLRAMGDRRIEHWSQDLLRLGEEFYQEGDLDAAVSAARTVPLNTKSYSSTRDLIDRWKDSWNKAQETYDQAKAEINQQNWNDSLRIAKGLLVSGNRYWEKKYQEVMDELQAAKEQRSQAKDSKNSSKPEKTGNRNYEVEAASHLQKAKDLARQGSPKGLKAAIKEAQQIYYGTPAYETAQKQIEAWQQQMGAIEDRRHLDRAINLAKKGDEASLQAGVDEAYEVSPSGSLYDEARRRIDQWTDQLYRLKYPPLKDPVQNSTKVDRPASPPPPPEPDLPPP
jgi:soluble cytochrome b562